MEIKFDVDKGAEFAYKADYCGYKTVPICARIGYGNMGRSSRTHSNVLELILGDLKNCKEKITPIYTKDYIDVIGPEIKKITDLSIRLLNDYNRFSSEIEKQSESLLKLNGNNQDIDYKVINLINSQKK
jgi:hypothetical protein